MYYVKGPKGLPARVFRYENRYVGAHLEWCYHSDYVANGERARWYGFANRELPENAVKMEGN